MRKAKVVIGKEVAVFHTRWEAGTCSHFVIETVCLGFILFYFLSVFTHDYRSGLVFVSLHPGHRVTLFDVGIQQICVGSMKEHHGRAASARPCFFCVSPSSPRILALVHHSPRTSLVIIGRLM